MYGGQRQLCVSVYEGVCMSVSVCKYAFVYEYGVLPPYGFQGLNSGRQT